MTHNLLSAPRFILTVIALGGMVLGVPALHASTVAHVLASGDLTQNWTNVALLSTPDDWAAVPSIMGFLGDVTGTGPGASPSTRLSAALSGTVDVNVNQTNPSGFGTGGVTEFEITDPVVGLAGSGTADAPNLVFYLDSTGRASVSVRYNLRDLNGSADNAVQGISLQYRVGGVGDFIAIQLVDDATSGPNLATLVTPVMATLPVAANNQGLVEVRIITSDATGNDEYVGIDDIVISSVAVPEPGAGLLLGMAVAMAVGRGRRRRMTA